MKHAAIGLAAALPLLLAIDGHAAPSPQSGPASAKSIFEGRGSAFDARTPVAPVAEAEPAGGPGGRGNGGSAGGSGPAERFIDIKQRPVGLRYRIKLIEPEGPLFVPNSRVFRSGDQIQLLLSSNIDAHLAILQVADGGMELLYPDTELGLTQNRVTARKEIVFPGPEHGFRFVDEPGTERLLVVLAETPKHLRELNLQARLDGRQGAKLLDMAGDKRLQIVEVARSEEATYAVNIGGGFVVQEIRLTHR